MIRASIPGQLVQSFIKPIMQLNYMLLLQNGGLVKFRSVLAAILVAFFSAGALPCPVIGQDADVPIDASADLAAAEGADLPADVPVEERKSAVPNSPQEIVKAVGWPFTIVFGFASIVALWCGIERLVLLRRRRVIPRAFVDRFLQHLRSGRMDKPNAIAVCQQDGSPTADVFLHGVRKWGKPSVEIEQAVIDGGERQISQLKKRLRVLNGVATLSPLIGLLGTVIGMIQAFNDIAESNAMGQAEELARGIAMALLTTAIGLFIAIPALTAYMYLAGRIDALVMEMDRLGQELVHLISAEALRERGDVRPLSPGDLQAINKATKEKKS